MGMEVLAIISGGLKFASTFSQYKWRSAQANYESKILEANAQSAAWQAREQEARFRRNFARFEGSTRVARAKSGVTDSGSFSWIQDSNAQAAELDAMTIRYNGELKRLGLSQAAATKRAEATMFRRQALFNSLMAGSNQGAQTQSILGSGSQNVNSSGGI